MSNPSDSLDSIYLDAIGYLNSSSSTLDPRFFRSINGLLPIDGKASHVNVLRSGLLESLANLQSKDPQFRSAIPVEAVIRLTLDEVLPAYRSFHSDLLFHLKEHDFEQPFLLGRMFEAVLASGRPWTDTARIVKESLDRLNDFVGHRPVAVLPNGQTRRPYPHEYFRPVPLYIRGAGVANGPFRDVVEQTLQLLDELPREFLLEAHFNLDCLEEVALDTRAHDHEHPVNKRTNYLFGEWDPQRIGGDSLYCRFILRTLILEGMLNYIDSSSDEYSEAVFDTAAVLGGTMLMASYISGKGPKTHSSTVSLSDLLPKVARFRESYYELLMSLQVGARAKRISDKMELSGQPFGHVRQYLNIYVSQYGARQIQQRRFVSLYVRMGYTDAATKEANIILCRSASFECNLSCRIVAAHNLVAQRRLNEAGIQLREITKLLDRGIECGAIVDPWNIRAYNGQFMMFFSTDDFIVDPRIDTLLELMSRIFDVFSAAVGEAAALGDNPNRDDFMQQFHSLAQHWDRYATPLVKDLREVNGHELYKSTELVVEILEEWRRAGQHPGDELFWKQQAERIPSAIAFGTLSGILLRKHDGASALCLLTQWLRRAGSVGLESRSSTLHSLLSAWLNQMTSRGESEDTWAHIRFLFRSIASNSAEFGDVPTLADITTTGLPAQERRRAGFNYRPEFAIDSHNLDDDGQFAATLDQVVFKDSTDDGYVGDDGFNLESPDFKSLTRQFEPRLSFLGSLVELWQQSVLLSFSSGGSTVQYVWDEEIQLEEIQSWLLRLRSMQHDLSRFLEEIWDTEVSSSTGTHDENVEYDFQLQTKFYLLQNAIHVGVGCRQSERLLSSCLDANSDALKSDGDDVDIAEQLIVETYRAILNRNSLAVRQLIPRIEQELVGRPLLYTPLEERGHPGKILRARSSGSLMQFLVEETAQMGLMSETLSLLKTAFRMEKSVRTEGLSVSEFDRIFVRALKGSVECVIRSAELWQDEQSRDETLITIVRDIVDLYQQVWHRHSCTMRLSVIEVLHDEEQFGKVRDFVKRYGADLFIARMLTLGHLRVILHTGTEQFIDILEEQMDTTRGVALRNDLDSGVIGAQDAAEQLKIIYGCIVDKFDRFLDYNVSTVHSDYGEKIFYLLDFLRVESSYDRKDWELRPHAIAYDCLALHGNCNSAALWEAHFKSITHDDAERCLGKLHELEEKYGMRLATTRARIQERFIASLSKDRVLALVPKAMSDAGQAESNGETFRMMSDAIGDLRGQIVGSAVDAPPWIKDVEAEVAKCESLNRDAALGGTADDARLPQVRLDAEQFREQIKLMREAN